MVLRGVFDWNLVASLLCRLVGLGWNISNPEFALNTHVCKHLHPPFPSKDLWGMRWLLWERSGLVMAGSER